MNELYQTFLREIDGVYLTRRTLSFIYEQILNVTPYGFQKTFTAMKETFRKEIEEKNLVRPIANVIPKPIVLAYLETCGVDEEKIRSMAKDYFARR